MNTAPLGLILIAAGLVLVAVGVFFYFGSGWLGFLGKLPGDIRIEHPNFKFYFPITTCILISILLTVLFFIISRLR